MMWVTNQKRPDLSFETCIMSNDGKHPTVKTIHEANKAVRKLKSKRIYLNPNQYGGGALWPPYSFSSISPE